MPRKLLVFSSVCALGVCAAAGAPASTATAMASAMEGPQIGLVLVSPPHSAHFGSQSAASHELRAMVGVPGAAVLSEEIALPDNLAGIWVAPRQSYALVSSGSGISTSVITVRALAASAPQPISGALDQPNVVAFGPSGRTATLYSSASGRVQVITGLPTDPHIFSDYLVTIRSGVRLLAVSDDGSVVLAGAEDNNVYLLVRSGTSDLVHSAGKLAALTFLPGKFDAALVDSSQGMITVLHGLDGSPTPMLVASHLSGLSGGLSLEAPDSGDALILSIPAQRVALVVDLASLQIRSVPTTIRASILQPLQHPNQFVLSAAPGNSAWIFDYSKEGARVYFVPAPAHGGTSDTPPEGSSK